MEPAISDSAQTVFHCKPPTEMSPVGRVMLLALLGAIVGGAGWFEVDRTLAISHIACWLGAGMIIFIPFGWFIERNPVLSFSIDEGGLTIARALGTRTFAWADITAARFQDYPLAHSGGQTIRCFLLRAAGEKFELTPEFPDEETRDAFEDAMLDALQSHEIPETSHALPSFERMLSLGGACVFAASIVGMLAAHALGYHTLGTIFGLAFLFTGSIIAWMTRGQRLSRIVLVATLALIVGGTGILWACHVNVRDVLNRWEQVEKR
jgi:hypothetical protein